MQIIIVEDEVSCCQQLKECLKNWGRKHNIPIAATCYESGDELLRHNLQNTRLIFMDIDLPGLTGMETAQNLRKSNYKGHIIFLTAYSEHVFDGISCEGPGLSFKTYYAGSFGKLPDSDPARTEILQLYFAHGRLHRENTIFPHYCLCHPRTLYRYHYRGTDFSPEDIPKGIKAATS